MFWNDFHINMSSNAYGYNAGFEPMNFAISVHEKLLHKLSYDSQGKNLLTMASFIPRYPRGKGSKYRTSFKGFLGLFSSAVRDRITKALW